MTDQCPASTTPRAFAVTNWSVLAIAAPMTLAYLTTPLLGIVDTAVVGQLGDAALLGGLAAGAILFDVVFSAFNFIRSGTTGLVAQAFGRGDTQEERLTLLRAMILAIAIGLAIAALSPLISLAGQWFMNAEPAVSAALDTYVRIRCLGAPFSLMNYAILGYVLGRGEGGLGLFLQLVLNSVNIALSIAFGLWLGWGVAGVAWGTVAGECAGMLVGLAIIAWRFRNAPAPGRSRLLDAAAFRRMLALNRDIMIRSFSLLLVFALFARQGVSFGTLTLAANAVLMNFFMIAAFFLEGFAAAAEQLAGRAVGARARSSFDTAVKLTIIWGLVMAGVAALASFVWGASLIAIITTAEDVRQAAVIYLPWAALSALSGVLAFQMDGIFIGATWSRDMRNMMLLSVIFFLAALLLLPPLFGNHGLWAALHIFLLARGFTLFAALRKRVKQL
jgi:MATE family multidrug resistance protein